MYAGLKIKNKTIFFQFIRYILKYLQKNYRHIASQWDPTFSWTKYFWYLYIKIKWRSWSFHLFGGGGVENLKVKIRNLTIKLKLHVYINLTPPPPTRHRSKIFMILFFFFWFFSLLILRIILPIFKSNALYLKYMYYIYCWNSSNLWAFYFTINGLKLQLIHLHVSLIMSARTCKFFSLNKNK